MTGNYRSPAQFISAVWANKKRRVWWIILLTSLIIIGAIYLVAGTYANKTRRVARALPVVVAKIGKSDVPVYISGLGSVTPKRSVSVRTQINGQLIKVNFKDGQMVKAGDLLAVIDPRPYQAQLTQYEGQLTRDQALLQNARLDLERYKVLWQQNSVAKQTLDTQQALVNQYLGTAKLDQGLVENARLNLSYCYITAPVDGRIGLALVTQGNFVQTSTASNLAIINSVDPISVTFSITEADLPAVMKQFKAQQTLPVEAYDPKNSQKLAAGALTAIDNQIDSSTGMVKLLADFTNTDGLLFPNQFVNVRLLVDTLKNALIVPNAAIQHGPGGPFVYVWDKQAGKVHVTSVEVGISYGNYTVIRSGVHEDQSVVISGVDKLTDGASVTLAPQAS